jgi:hypothetical protein
VTDQSAVGGTRPASATARLTGTGLLADDLYLMAHDDVTGRAFLHPRALGLGLAGGLLAELLLAGRLRLWQGRVIADDAAGPADTLGQRVLGLVVTERDRHPVRDWLAFVARTAAKDVAARLEHAGYLTPVRARLPWRGERWVPVDPDCAFTPLGRARAALHACPPPAVARVTLAGLAVACGLGPRLFPYGPPGARQHLDDAIARLTPCLRELIAQVQAAVDSAMLAQRL